MTKDLRHRSTNRVFLFFLFYSASHVTPPPPPPDQSLPIQYDNQGPAVIPLSTLIQLRSSPYMPYVAHKRLVTIVHTPVHSVPYSVYHAGELIPIRVRSRVRPSILAAELARIRSLPRPTYVSHLERFLNSKDNIYFDDEAREIRARVDSLLRRIHVYVPRASPSDFAEEIVPERLRCGDYVHRLLSGRNNTKKDLDALSWYEVPDRADFGNLACVKYVAGKPHSVRRPYYKVADLRPSDIKNDVNFLSYYSKNRQAAANASPGQPMTERELRKARALETEYSAATPKKAPEAKQEAVVEPVKEPEPVREPEPEAEPEPEVQPEPEPEPETVQEAPAEKKKEKKSKKHKDKEEDVRKADKEEVLKAAGRALAKQAAEALYEEERQKKADEERLAMELEEQKAWEALKLAQEMRERAEEINEQERREAERKAEEEKLEEEHREAERIAREEREAAEAAVAAAEAAEEERIAIEKSLEEQSKRQELEATKLAEVAAAADVTEEPKVCEDEPADVEEITDQEREEKPYEVITQEDTKVEEENVCAEEEPKDCCNEPLIEEHEGIHSVVVDDNATVEDEPQVEEAVVVTEEKEVVEEEEKKAVEEEVAIEEEAAIEEEITQEEAAAAPEVATDAEEESAADGGEQSVTIEVTEEQEEHIDAAPVANDEPAMTLDEPEVEEEFSWGDQDS
ncbi:uncharacterized protein CG45076-like isoform X2 [Prorops nasuta]|uniref:uncharacterized protein CG45076-like isoform X2 n=1 Tax=Prorops nasuta TaxID=863751 RepID=UPI0034D00D11